MSDRSVLVVGAGVGGLSAACYAAMNGYKVRVLEMHGVSGGVCAAWRRGVYLFDGCIHNLAGTSPWSRYHAMWKELGVIPNLLMQSYGELVRVERPDGEPLVIDADLDRLERRLTGMFPQDAAALRAMIADARRLSDFDFMGMALASPLERVRALAKAPLLMKWANVTLEDYAMRFHDPFLRQAFPSLVYDWPRQSMAMLLVFLAAAHNGDLGWPIGGSAALAHAIERRLRELGGQIEHDVRVDTILVEDGRAAGVRTVDGRELRADVVVSNANGYDTIFRMLGGRHVSAAVRRYYGRPEDRIEMGVHVALGVRRNLQAEPHAFVLPLDPPAWLDGEMRHRLYVQTFGFDASMAPAGKSVIKVLFGTSFDRWRRLREDPEEYRSQKQRILDETIRLLERRFPGLAGQVEMSDVATPMTTLRYTGNGHGYRMPATRLALQLFTGCKLSQTLPGLRDFYMVGQWAGVPGVPMTAAMGRDVARAICRRDGRAFMTHLPPPARAARAAWPAAAA